MQRLTPAQVYHQRKHLIDQKMADCLQADAGARVAANYLAPGVVNYKVGDISKGEYVTVGSLAATKPRLATRRSRMPEPSRMEA